MPWHTDENGEVRYTVSLYTKDELPTWTELYAECYCGEKFCYDPKNVGHQIRDPYWNIPKRKFILATVCNQLNKMLFEDGKLAETLAFISSEILPGTIDIRFSCEPIDDGVSKMMSSDDKEHWARCVTDALVGEKFTHPIYTIPNPNGTPNFFIINKTIPRRDISTMNKFLCLHPYILFEDPNGSKSNLMIYTPLPFIDDQKDDHHKIIEFLLKDVIGYFSGEIGWKNPMGELVENIVHPKKCLSGRDPAL